MGVRELVLRSLSALTACVSLAAVLAYLQRKHGPPLLYMLPYAPALATLEAEASLFDSLYLAEHAWQKALDADARWSTKDAGAAVLYHLPLLHVRAASNGPPEWGVVIEHFAAAAPLLPQGWALNRTVLWMVGDMGICDLEGEVGATLSEATWVTHFGLHTDVLNRTCHDPNKWVVAPSFSGEFGAMQEQTRQEAGQKRNLLFTYYGPAHGNGEAARSEVLKHWTGRRDLGFSVGENRDFSDGRTMGDDIRNSTFCGAPHGAGWGSRLSLCIALGAIPVILQDDSTLPLEPFLDYASFSVRVATLDICRLDSILRSFSAAAVAAMAARLLEVAAYFDWDTAHGGRAFEATMQTIHAVMRRRGVLPPL